MRKESMLKVIMAVVVLVLTSLNVSGVIWGNGVEWAFGYGGGDKQPATTETPLREYVITGAGYFLDSHTQVLRFLKQYELAGLNGSDCSELEGILKEAITAIKNAEDTYIALTQEVEKTSYDPTVIDALIGFDYSAFQNREHLNATIFAGVSHYLARGDVRGVCGRLLDDIKESKILLFQIRRMVESNKFPALSHVRKLGLTYSGSYIFGQYVAMVCDEAIKSEIK
ncbi:MAG: hypothetical protein GY757_48155 [bacterium]|nr:hypothetical protein [bacterium]